jgi:hypothetical protein
MDNQRFDQLARMVARGASRRQLLKGLAGGVVATGFVGVARGARPAAAQDDVCTGAGGECSTGEDCCSGLCSESGICYCVDPDFPPVGCPCFTYDPDPCGGGTVICCPTTNDPSDPGICTRDSVGCNPQGCRAPGNSCEINDDCCEGSCSDEGVCYCLDPSRPGLGCSCDTGTESPCGVDAALTCCPTTNTPGGPGICTSDSVGCEPVGCSGAGDGCATNDDCCAGSCSDAGICYCEDPDRPALGCPCTTGTEDACGDTTLVCCSTGGAPGSYGVCTSGSVGCEPTGDDDDDGGATVTPAPVTTLPGTGVGPSGSDSSVGRFAPLALLTGGAAVAWRVLRGKPSSAE